MLHTSAVVPAGGEPPVDTLYYCKPVPVAVRFERYSRFINHVVPGELKIKNREDDHDDHLPCLDLRHGWFYF